MSILDIIEVIFQSAPETIAALFNFYKSIGDDNKIGFREQIKTFNSTLYQNEGEYYEKSNFIFQEAIQTGILEISHQKKIYEENDRINEKNNAELILASL
jgi:hypothetical protein